MGLVWRLGQVGGGWGYACWVPLSLFLLGFLGVFGLMGLVVGRVGNLGLAYLLPWVRVFVGHFGFRGCEGVLK